MAKESDLHTRGILGDINPVPAARDHIAGPSGVEDSDDDAEPPGSRDVSQAMPGPRSEGTGTTGPAPARREAISATGRNSGRSACLSPVLSGTCDNLGDRPIVSATASMHAAAMLAAGVGPQQ
jgi:hypothetical protein